MKNKFLLAMMLTVLTLFGVANVPAAEAAAQKVAVLPLINLGEENAALTGILMDQTVAKFTYPKYDLMQDDKVIEAAQKAGYFEWGKQGVNEQKLESLRQQLGADILVMVMIEKTEVTSFSTSNEEYLDVGVRMQNAAVYSWKKPFVQKVSRDERDLYGVAGDKGAEKMVKKIITSFMNKVVEK